MWYEMARLRITENRTVTFSDLDNKTGLQCPYLTPKLSNLVWC